ncbi:hypothetical protein [Nonomuraea lactucae]|uniref:hypothetical protein n=1 Tax=Nonomuraea lactucae TaxID=2249762 RepID=UPI000DE3260B|nr:hypothetical protein [Nonomuraea lactucae]
MISRRTLLGAGSLSILGSALLPALPAAAASAGPFTLAPLPDGAPVRTLFAPAEQRFAPYLKTLAPMVADMEAGGFFAGGWWRTPAAPYNARVQEHVFTLAWFHANARPWNPYAGDRVLLSALDAALGHYLSLQNDDGSFPEYAPNEHHMAATGFGLGYLSKTLRILRRADMLPERRRQLAVALAKAMTWFLDPNNRTVWQTRLTFANQTTSGLAGSALALRLDHDAALRRALRAAIERLATSGQSPAGFFYEERGMDMNYNFEVMLPEMADAYHQTHDRTLVDMAAKFTDWLGYNLLREPDGSGYIANVAPSARTSTRFYDEVRSDPDRTALNSLFVPLVPALGAFMTAREDLAAARSAWAADPAPVRVLAKQDTSPRILAHGLYGEAFPTRRRRAAAVAELPYLRSDDFAELRRDQGQDFLYVRKPRLYAGGYFGTRATSSTRTGLTFLWHPAAGTIVHSLNDNNYACWSTVLPGQKPDSNGPMTAEYFAGEPGGTPWTGGDAPATFGVRYRTPDGAITTDVIITADSLRRSVRSTAAATEQIPLVLLPTDTLTFTDGTKAAHGGSTNATADGLDVRRGDTLIRFRWGGARPATLAAGSPTYFRDARRRFHALRIPHAGTIDVTVSLG